MTGHDDRPPVLIGYDGHDDAAAELLGARKAIVQTVWTSYEEVVAAGVIGMPAAMAAAGAERPDQELEERARGIAEEGVAVAKAAGLDASGGAARERGSTSRTLIHGAGEHRAAAMVVGSHGRSAISATLLGSVAAGLVHHSPVPLLVVPDRR
jgi:nucleotide-binding universal stress UspA family protein